MRKSISKKINELVNKYWLDVMCWLTVAFMLYSLIRDGGA